MPDTNFIQLITKFWKKFYLTPVLTEYTKEAASAKGFPVFFLNGSSPTTV